jgi:eIF3 subunit 6 N terminal domain
VCVWLCYQYRFRFRKQAHTERRAAAAMVEGGDQAADAAAPSTGVKHDLTRVISEYLDLHLMFPLLDFVEQNNMYPAAGVAQARLDLLEPTNMVRGRQCSHLCALCSGSLTV